MSTLVTQPHFFKPLIPGFDDDFSIPAAFSKYLKGHERDEAQITLRSRQRGKYWPVKINGRRLGDGWKQFVQDHDLRVADFLVFRYDGDLLFFVLVFDRTTCERVYPGFVAIDEDENVPIQEPNVPSFADTDEDFEKKKDVKCRLQANGGTTVLEHPYCNGSDEDESIQIQEQNVSIYTATGKNFEKRKNVKCRLETNARSTVLERPYCVIKLTPESCKSSRLHIPWKFAREHGLYGRCCSMILKDENGSCWPAKLLHKSSDGKTIVAGGWTPFRFSHKLKAGDSLIIELSRNGDTPVLEIRRLQENPETKKESMYHNIAQATSSSSGHLPSTAEQKIPEEEAIESDSRKWKRHKLPDIISEAKASSRVVHQRFFVTKVESMTSKLYIPENFARHFENKTYSKVILIDRERRSWPASLCQKGDVVYIGNVCDEFFIANNLNPGDRFVFECIEMGDRLAFKMYVFKTNHLEAASSSLKKRCVYLTVLASHSRNCQMTLPRNFARRNGLDTSISSEMTITNEMGNSWQVTLKVDKSGGSFIRNGWTTFARENGIRVGDVLIFELFNGGTTLLMKYYAVKQDLASNEKVIWEDLEDAS
ncbi:Transcriptional factor B3 family protein [Euphorbia peplus]|nr:Transcriptional factor B3 family protein [Euphorbia peplus]